MLKQNAENRVKEEETRKKIRKGMLSALLIVALAAMLSIPAFAAQGGTFQIDEGVGLTVQIPQEWAVFTQDMPKDDAEAQKYGGYEMLMESMRSSGVSLAAWNRANGLIFVRIDTDAEAFKGMNNLTDAYLRMNDKEKEALEEDVKKESAAEQGRVVGMYTSDEVNKKNNYVYVNIEYMKEDKKLTSYATVINEKLVVFTHYPVGAAEPSEEDKAALLSVLSTARYNNQPTAEEVTNTLAQEKARRALLAKVGAGISALILVLIVYRLAVRKRKRQEKASAIMSETIED